MVIITKSTIINNFDWINGPAMDLLDVMGFRTTFENTVNILREMPDMSIDTDVLKNKIKSPKNDTERLYNLFWELNERQNNKYTYLPNLVGMYLIINR